MRFLFVDEIVELVPGKITRGTKHITPTDYYLTTDEQGRSCFITSLIGEALGQLAAWNVMASNNFSQRPVAGVVASARPFRPAYINETLLLESILDYVDNSAVQYNSTARVNDEIIFSIEGALGPLLPMSDFIETADVKQQFDQINSSVNKSYIPSDTAQIPANFLTFDCILENTPGVSLHAEKIISDAAYFSDHFPRNPVLPMTILLECKINLATLFLHQAGWQNRYKIHELRKIKMNEFVRPGDNLNCFVTMHHQTDEQLILRYRSEVAGKRVCVLEIVLLKRDSSL